MMFMQVVAPNQAPVAGSLDRGRKLALLAPAASKSLPAYAADRWARQERARADKSTRKAVRHG